MVGQTTGERERDPRNKNVIHESIQKPDKGKHTET